MAKTKNRNKNKSRSERNPSHSQVTDNAKPTMGSASNSDSRPTTPDVRYPDGAERRSSLASSVSNVSSPRHGGHFVKRDSVVSTQAQEEEVIKPEPRPLRRNPRYIKHYQWWPCRIARSTCKFINAFVRVLFSKHWLDQLYTLCFLAIFLFGCWLAVEGLLKIFRPVTAEDANCSIVYVTIPGPVITVSLIGATASDPARGTYYYSVVNGTTEWLNSIAPPSRLSASTTGTGDIVVFPSGAPATGEASPIQTSKITTVPPSSPALPSTPLIFSSIVTTTMLSGSVFVTTRASNRLSQSLLTNSPTSQSLGLPSSSPLIVSSSANLPHTPPIEVTSTTTGSFGSTIVLTWSGTSFTSPVESNLGFSSRMAPSFLISTISQSQLPGSPPTSFVPPVSPISTVQVPSIPSSLGPPEVSFTEIGDKFSVSLPRPSSMFGITPSGTLVSNEASTAATQLLSASASLSDYSHTNLPSSLSHSGQTPTLNIPSSLQFSSGTSTSIPTSFPISSGFGGSPVTPMPSTNLLSTPGDGSSSPSLGFSWLDSSLSSMSPFSDMSTLGSISESLSPPGGSLMQPSSRFTLPRATTTTTPPPELSIIITSSPEASPPVISSAEGTPSILPSIWFNTTSIYFNITGTSSSSSSISVPSSSSSVLVPSITTSSSRPGSAITSSRSRTPIFSLSTIPPSGASSAFTTCSGSVSSAGCVSRRSDLMTKVIAYGEAAVTFTFPSPDIKTTVSYWTGTYPTVSGPEPISIPLTARSVRQTPLSGFPSFDLFTTKSSLSVAAIGAMADDSTLRKEDNMAAIAAVGDVNTEDGEQVHCGESGNFTLGFDDSTVGPEDDDIRLPVSGMKNPYHHLFYANGFTYVPDKWEPYPAVSQPNVAMFLPLTGRLLPNTPFAGSLLPGELGSGPRASVSAYWFNAYAGFFGCALSGLTPCILRVSGFRYDATLKQEVLAAEQNVTIPACPGYVNCRLTPVSFNDGFRGLSGIQFNAFTQNLKIPQAFMMDDLQMEWYNNTCSAGILRIGHR